MGDAAAADGGASSSSEGEGEDIADALKRKCTEDKANSKVGRVLCRFRLAGEYSILLVTGSFCTVGASVQAAAYGREELSLRDCQRCDLSFLVSVSFHPRSTSPRILSQTQSQCPSATASSPSLSLPLAVASSRGPSQWRRQPT